jgi:hypothetical protein
MSVVKVEFGTTPGGRLAHLRGLLAEKFPAVELKPANFLPTGLPALDEAEGGLRKGAVTELVSSPASGALFTTAMLSLAVRWRCHAALVDASRSFSVEGCESEVLRRLLWVMCGNARQAVRAADLLLRDANLPLVLLDLQSVPAGELRGIPTTTWHRFQRLAEQSSVAFVVLSVRPMVEAAQVRIVIKNRWSLAAMRQRRAELLALLELQSFSRRQFSELPGAVQKTA